MDSRTKCFLFSGLVVLALMLTFLLDNHGNNSDIRRLLDIVTGVGSDLDIEQAKLNALKHELDIAGDNLKAEKDTLKNEQDKLKTGQEKLKTDQENLKTEQEKLELLHDKLKTDQENFKRDRDIWNTTQNKTGYRRDLRPSNIGARVASDDPTRCPSCELIQSDPGPLSENWQQQYRDFIKFMNSQNRDYFAIGGFAMFAMRCGGYALQKDTYHREPWRGIFGNTDNDMDFVMVAHNKTDRDMLWEAAKTTFTSWQWSCIDWKNAGGWGCYPPKKPWYNYHYFFQVYVSRNETHFGPDNIPKSKVFPTASAKMYNVTVPVAR